MFGGERWLDRSPKGSKLDRGEFETSKVAGQRIVIDTLPIRFEIPRELVSLL